MTTLKRSALALVLAAVLAACGTQGEDANDTDTDTVVGPVGQSERVVSATGTVVPTREVTLAFRTSGQLVDLTVDVGDRVEEGDVIAQLDTATLDAQIQQAEAGLEVAEANLEKARAGARAAEIAEQEANVDAAQASAGVAYGQVNDLLSNPSETQLAAAEAQVEAAFITYWNARTFHDHLREEYGEGDARVESAQEQMNAAERDLRVAEQELQTLQSLPNDDQLRAARSDAAAAALDLDAAEATLNLTTSGPTNEDIAVAQAAVDQAEASLEQVELLREQAVIRAPFDGTVAELFLLDSQFVNAGTPAMTLADLNSLRIETTDLNELDVAEIGVGDEATVTFDALPDVELTGTVTQIAPKADEGTGVNFRVVVTVDDLPEEVRWGMTAFVDIPIEQ
jgi:HlyD family secretion protein